ncbi:hypothetical protein ABL78_4093 [Leptomonas seymouri]|uniref:Uncharacterized protein n=1 Tax=Leptomonas seymouri TaxID=5684 RepID=A0A0N0P5S7_LEPSE|nr:hypothetical protein ABL78_4093 [Leptomonas seymouri]|eukprot:KPI86816.1 hypothetical protein ABL78_4093 [Leptomonas seymouri]
MGVLHVVLTEDHVFFQSQVLQGDAIVPALQKGELRLCAEAVAHNAHPSLARATVAELQVLLQVGAKDIVAATALIPAQLQPPIECVQLMRQPYQDVRRAAQRTQLRIPLLQVLRVAVLTATTLHGRHHAVTVLHINGSVEAGTPCLQHVIEKNTQVLMVYAR